MHGCPAHHQADHPALVVERVVHPLLLAALRGLGVVGARKVKDERGTKRTVVSQDVQRKTTQD